MCPNDDSQNRRGCHRCPEIVRVQERSLMLLGADRITVCAPMMILRADGDAVCASMRRVEERNLMLLKCQEREHTNRDVNLFVFGHHVQ